MIWRGYCNETRVSIRETISQYKENCGFDVIISHPVKGFSGGFFRNLGQAILEINNRLKALTGDNSAMLNVVELPAASCRNCKQVIEANDLQGHQQHDCLQRSKRV